MNMNLTADERKILAIAERSKNKGVPIVEDRTCDVCVYDTEGHFVQYLHRKISEKRAKVFAQKAKDVLKDEYSVQVVESFTREIIQKL